MKWKIEAEEPAPDDCQDRLFIRSNGQIQYGFFYNIDCDGNRIWVAYGDRSYTDVVLYSEVPSILEEFKYLFKNNVSE